MNTSYKRYWEPSTLEAISSSVTVAALFTSLLQPFEFVKTRVQIKAEGLGIRQINLYGGYNPNKAFREIHANGGGLRQFFNGLDAAVFARTSHLLIRNFLYKIIYDLKKPFKPTNDLSNKEKAVIAGFSGFVAAYVSNPFELVMIRQIYDVSLAAKSRRNYANAKDGLLQIMKNEGGASALWKGANVTALRAVLLNISLTGCFDYLNERMWITFGETIVNRPISIFWAALWGSLLTLPIDNIKTRLQKQFPDPTKNRINYQSAFDALVKIVQIEGLQAFLVGFYPYYARVSLYTLGTVYVMDKITTRWKKQAGLREEYI